MSQLSHAEDASFSHEGESSVTATESEWVRAHPSYTKIRLIQVVGFFATLVGVFTVLTVMFEMMRSSGALPKTTWLPALTGAIAAVLVVWGIWCSEVLEDSTERTSWLFEFRGSCVITAPPCVRRRGVSKARAAAAHVQREYRTASP